MSSSSIEFHKIWIDQCAATEDIRESFGLKDALDYLIGEKLFTFLMASEQDAEFAAEVPAFVDQIRRIFTTEEIRAYLDYLERTKFLAPPDPVMDIDDPDDEMEGEPWPENPVMGGGRVAPLLTRTTTSVVVTAPATPASPALRTPAENSRSKETSSRLDGTRRHLNSRAAKLHAPCFANRYPGNHARNKGQKTGHIVFI